MEQSPSGYTYGLGELVRAYRLYIGLSQRGMAKNLDDMDRRSYQRIENGQDACPPGLLDSVNQLVSRFDTYVAAKALLPVQGPGSNESAVLQRFTSVPSPADPRQEFQRCVVSRAVVLSGTMIPVLTSDIEH